MSSTHTAFSPLPPCFRPFACALPLPGSLFLLFPLCKPGFPICLLRPAADTVLMPFPTPEATSTHFLCLPQACSGNGGGVANAAQTTGARELWAEEPGAGGRTPASLSLSQRHNFGHHLQFFKGASRAEPGHPQCNHLLTHLPALLSLSWASPCFLGAPPRETTPTLVFVAGPAFGGPGLSHLFPKLRIPPATLPCVVMYHVPPPPTGCGHLEGGDTR